MVKRYNFFTLQALMYYLPLKATICYQLEQFGCFLGQLLLNKCAQSARTQRSILLRHTDASYVKILKKRLIEEEKMLRKHRLSYLFYPTEIKINLEKLEVLLFGDRVVLASGKKISAGREGYLLRFTDSGNKLFLKDIAPYDCL